ncbi:hypothetical protein JKP88DRAFT_354177 [Tribonema minus]|uniref:RING-type E3 ubiquitin transferase n=1 Tax=Tribonema minus TaxID=303371 RepID=A0A835Z8Q1_9STRA|nr:hypothetical protein JKP88DRAFT_354177 [Tribonema minus]
MWGRPVPGASALSAFGCLLLLLRCSGGCAAPAAAACAAAGAAGSTCGGGTDAAVSFIYLAFIGVFTLLGCCLWGLARRAHHALAARAAMLRVHQLPHFRWGVAPACARGGSTVGGSGSGGGGAEDGVEPSAKCPLCEGAGCAKAAPECSVCLSSFEAGEEVRQLPCKHLYHKACIDKWFESQKDTCPLCMVPVWEQRIAPRGGRRRARAPPRAATARAALPSNPTFTTATISKSGSSSQAAIRMVMSSRVWAAFLLRLRLLRWSAPRRTPQPPLPRCKIVGPRRSGALPNRQRQLRTP